MTASVVSTIAKNPLLLRNLWRLFCVNRTESEFRKRRMVRTVRIIGVERQKLCAVYAHLSNKIIHIDGDFRPGI